MQNKPAMTDFVVDLLKNKIPPFYYYHNYEHTLYVVDKAIEIGKKENCSEHEMDLVKAAALWHDTGFIKTYLDHEQESCILAAKYLPQFGYNAEEINQICGMIMATKIPQSPKNKLEEIVADADLEYLATDAAAEKAGHLFQEWKRLDPLLTDEECQRREISFLKAHHYFTNFCKEKKEPHKLAYLDRLTRKRVS